MEIADQWQREWAGTAEYGKVVEGGVTRRVARAMEVLHASGPGAKVRVMRAAYHSTAGPGMPTSSYMLHSSRRVFSSGFNFLEPLSPPIKPLEICSLPLESSPEPQIETGNYKVTEPDDLEISEPSTWRSSTGGNIRMPSEESSSTDNASIIDLDSKPHKNTLRKYSYDSETSDITQSGRNSRFSPLLDAPITLSTLKFKSLLNGSSDWNSRRKSYSFEDTSPLTETVLHSNDTITMESSTDSGICKSTEIVNGHIDENQGQHYDTNENGISIQDESFQSWLSKNRLGSNNYNKGPKLKPHRRHEVVTEEPTENGITLQSSGKVTITLPIKVETEDGYHYQQNYINEDGQRKTKKVGFCKTELHFAADTGKVNIIATDEKPPPSNDFRKRRSAFVPMHDMLEKPITLYGDKVYDSPDVHHNSNSPNYVFNEYNESDDNTGETKSILKNKIPKPKPYLLGENMDFGPEEELNLDETKEVSRVQTAVSLINKQLQVEKRCDNEIAANFYKQDGLSHRIHSLRTIKEGPPTSTRPNETLGLKGTTNEKNVRIQENVVLNSVKNTRLMERSPTPARMRTRELRESDLTYFGLNNQQKTCNINKHLNSRSSLDDSDIDIFQSVKLIQQVSNSRCNSESDDTPEYINIPLNTDFAPIPTPRIRSNFDDKPNHIEEVVVFKPIMEHMTDKQDEIVPTRRSKLRRQDNSNGFSNRSISEPRKSYYYNSAEKSKRIFNQTQRTVVVNPHNKKKKLSKCEDVTTPKEKNTPCEDSPIYENLSSRDSKVKTSYTNIEPRLRKACPDHANFKSKDGQGIDKVVIDKAYSKNDKVLIDNKDHSKYKIDESKKVVSTDKSSHSVNSLRKSRKGTHDKKSTEGSYASTCSNFMNDSLVEKKEHKSRAPLRYTNKEPMTDINAKGRSLRNKNETVKIKSIETENKEKPHKNYSSKDHTKKEPTRTLPEIENSTIDKSTISRDLKTTNAAKSRKSEYVINYDDKNGTVSSVRKIRSGFDSPRRKKASNENFKDNLKNKSSDKAALLQPEHHQWNVTVNGDTKRKSKVYVKRSCQVL